MKIDYTTYAFYTAYSNLAKTHRRVHCMKIRTFRHKYRFCTNLREEDLVFLRQSAGLSDDETVCLLIIKQFGISRRKANAAV